MDGKSISIFLKKRSEPLVAYFVQYAFQARSFFMIYFFLSSSIVAFRAAIFSTESLSFLRSKATTFSGA